MTDSLGRKRKLEKYFIPCDLYWGLTKSTLISQSFYLGEGHILKGLLCTGKQTELFNIAKLHRGVSIHYKIGTENIKYAVL